MNSILLFYINKNLIKIIHRYSMTIQEQFIELKDILSLKEKNFSQDEYDYLDKFLSKTIHYEYNICPTRLFNEYLNVLGLTKYRSLHENENNQPGYSIFPFTPNYKIFNIFRKYIPIINIFNDRLNNQFPNYKHDNIKNTTDIIDQIQKINKNNKIPLCCENESENNIIEFSFNLSNNTNKPQLLSFPIICPDNYELFVIYLKIKLN